MFWRKHKKKGIPLHTPVLLYKSGVQWGIHCTYKFSWCIGFITPAGTIKTCDNEIIISSLQELIKRPLKDKHYENMPMQYKEIFRVEKNENFQ